MTYSERTTHEDRIFVGCIIMCVPFLALVIAGILANEPDIGLTYWPLFAATTAALYSPYVAGYLVTDGRRDIPRLVRRWVDR